MKRLTKRLSNGEAMLDCDKCELRKRHECEKTSCRDQLIERLAACEDIGCTPEKLIDPSTWKAVINLVAQNVLGIEMGRLRELAEADKAGRVIITDTLTTDADGIGLRQKYRVCKAKDNTPVDGCFVLRPEKDPAARIAMEAYAKATENKILAEDMLKAIGDSGRCVVLPCKVYETDGARVYEHAVQGIIYRTVGGPDFDENAIWKSIFLTREGAEKALEEREGKKDG